MKYEYGYVPLRTGGLFNENEHKKHRKIITRMAQQGWRYAGYIPTSFSAHGSPMSVDLVFERPLSDDPDQ